jgi:hypothetical protein
VCKAAKLAVDERKEIVERARFTIAPSAEHLADVVRHPLPLRGHDVGQNSD